MMLLYLSMDFLTVLRLIAYMLFAGQFLVSSSLAATFKRESRKLKNDPKLYRLNRSLILFLNSLTMYSGIRFLLYSYTIFIDNLDREQINIMTIIYSSILFIPMLYLRRVINSLIKVIAEKITTK